MSIVNNFIITEQGLDALSYVKANATNSTGGVKLQFTHLALGEGENKKGYDPVQSTRFAGMPATSQTALKSEKARLPLSKFEDLFDGRGVGFAARDISLNSYEVWELGLICKNHNEETIVFAISSDSKYTDKVALKLSNTDLLINSMFTVATTEHFDFKAIQTTAMPSATTEKEGGVFLEKSTELKKIETDKVPTFNTMVEVFQKHAPLLALPTGFIGMWGKEEPPEGWLLCDGSELDVFDEKRFNELKALCGGFEYAEELIRDFPEVLYGDNTIDGFISFNYGNFNNYLKVYLSNYELATESSNFVFEPIFIASTVHLLLYSILIFYYEAKIYKGLSVKDEFLNTANIKKSIPYIPNITKEHAQKITGSFVKDNKTIDVGRDFAPRVIGGSFENLEKTRKKLIADIKGYLTRLKQLEHYKNVDFMPAVKKLIEFAEKPVPSYENAKNLTKAILPNARGRYPKGKNNSTELLKTYNKFNSIGRDYTTERAGSGWASDGYRYVKSVWLTNTTSFDVDNFAINYIIKYS